jgi:hypothetical protein
VKALCEEIVDDIEPEPLLVEDRVDKDIDYGIGGVLALYLFEVDHEVIHLK